MKRTRMIGRPRTGKDWSKKAFVKKCEKCGILLGRAWESSPCSKCGSFKEVKKSSYDKLVDEMRARGILGI